MKQFRKAAIIAFTAIALAYNMPAAAVSVNPMKERAEIIEKLSQFSHEDIAILASFEHRSATGAANGRDDVFSLALFGVDSDSYREKIGMGYRIDTVIIMTVNISNGSCIGISVPRDTQVQLNNIDKKGSVIGKKTDRINAALTYGKGPDKYGYLNTVTAVNDLFVSAGVNPKIKGYVALDMDAVSPLTEAVDGVPVELLYNMKDIGKKGELVELRGEKALNYLRMRQFAKGDLTRAENQQLFLKELAKRIQAKGALEMVPALIGSLQGNMSTNLSLNQMRVLASLLKNADVDKVEFKTIPGATETIEGVSYFTYDEKKLSSLLRSIYL